MGEAADGFGLRIGAYERAGAGIGRWIAGPSGGTAEAAVALLAGSTASELVLGAGVAGTFPEGCLVAVDLDYQQQVGFVGSGIAAAYVSDPEAVSATLITYDE